MSIRRAPTKAVLAPPAALKASRLAGALDIGKSLGKSFDESNMETVSFTRIQFYEPVMSAEEHMSTFTNFKTKLIESFDESKVDKWQMLEFTATAENNAYTFKLGYHVSFIKPDAHYVLKLVAFDLYDGTFQGEIAEIIFGESESRGDVREKLQAKLSEMEQDGGFTGDTWTVHFGKATYEGLEYLRPVLG